MASELTVFGGKGFVGSAYIRAYYDQAVGNIVSINDKQDFTVYSKDVLYLISTVHNYNVFTNPTLDIDTNLIVLMRVLENWRKRPDAKDGVFNFVSSWFVYGQQAEPHNVSEDAICDPKGFYSITKRCAEQLLMSYCSAHNLKYRILRLANVIGPGDRKVSAQKNALQFMANKLMEGIDVDVYGEGTFYRDYIYVDDCARAIDIVLNKGKVNEVYNIGNGKTWDFITILAYLKIMLNSKSQLNHIEPKEFHKKVQIPSFYMDTKKIQALGYVPHYTYAKLFNTLLRED
jgi:nucleoside-diphosphate-sugar epimerase